MNQHASRPVAQGFPLHRPMNRSIQPAGFRTTTQLRPFNPSTTTDGGPFRRSLFKSQIPIRTGFGAERSVVPQPSQQVLLRAQALEQHRQLFSTSQSSPAALQAIRTSAPGQQPIETAFKVYEDRLQTDLRDFRAMCSRLILQEQEEKEKWHTLCLKMMKERDTARQRVSALLSERGTSHLSSPSATASVSANEHLASKVSKRARDENSSAAQESTQELPSRSSPVESRPIRSLRSSPVPSPPGSPSASLYNSSTAIHSSSLPSTSSSSLPPSSNATSPLTLRSSPVNPLNIITFNPPRSPNDKTCFDIFGVVDIPETRPVKRRKSFDSSLSNKGTAEDGETIKGSSSCHPSRDEKDKHDAEASAPRPFLIAHTDIMYIPMKGLLSCRACLLDKTTNPSSSRHPTSFPTDVCWNELRDHVVSEHPAACADVARLCPADLNELRRRLYSKI